MFLPGVGILAGVGARFGLFLTGDPGREREGLIVFLPCGLAARAPGPTDWENLGIGGVGELFPPPLKVAPKPPGVLGVAGKLSELSAMEARFEAR